MNDNETVSQLVVFFFFSSRRRHTRLQGDWSSDVCSSDLAGTTVIHRASQLFLPTLREPPADAEAVNHKLLVRGAFVRQLTAGVWTFLPLGWRVHRKIERIIREEMDAIGSQEMLMPLPTPAEPWGRSGRGKI